MKEIPHSELWINTEYFIIRGPICSFSLIALKFMIFFHRREILMKHDELLKCLYSQLESIAETLVLIQENEECTRRIKKILTNQIGMLVFCQKEISEIKIKMTN